MCGRTVYGHSSAKVSNWKIIISVLFQKECMHLCVIMKMSLTNWVFLFVQDIMKWRLHNMSVLPIFEEVSVGVDHNSLLMDVMDRVARRHKLRVLLHEKPFAGINGSGKHNNWSMATDTGVNLLAPGKTPKTNLMFLTFFVNTIKAVHDYADVLRASIASAPNDHRLGANEAPPAIILCLYR
jgi:glutamine synthetase